MSSRVYQYQPLNPPAETRILTLFPGQFDDPLTGTLENISICHPDEPYEALSYCWGQSIVSDNTPAPDTMITSTLVGTMEDGTNIDTTEHMAFKDTLDHPYFGYNYIRAGGPLPGGVILLDGAQLTIGGELNRALRRLRDEEKPLRIWVDALCIDQSNLEERNEHVKSMGQIYANACHVHIWLGEESGIETGLLETMNKVDDVLYDLLIRRGMRAEGASIHEIQWHFAKSPETDHLEWDKVAEFVDRAWFHRIWVIQEIANAREATVHIGAIALQWEYVAGIFRMLRTYHLDHPITPHKGLKAITFMNLLRDERVQNKLSHSQMDLLEMLEEFRDFKSTLPSDKIYGIVGLTDQQDSFVVDYSKSPEQIFTDLAISYLHTGSLDILSHCVAVPEKPKTLELPSWVPDWTRAGWVEPFRIRGLRANACGHTVPSFYIDSGTKALHIKGRVLDRVVLVERLRQIPRPQESPAFFADSPDDAHPSSHAMVKAMSPRYRNDQRLIDSMRHTQSYHANIFSIAFPDYELRVLEVVDANDRRESDDDDIGNEGSDDDEDLGSINGSNRHDYTHSDGDTTSDYAFSDDDTTNTDDATTADSDNGDHDRRHDSYTTSTGCCNHLSLIDLSDPIYEALCHTFMCGRTRANEPTTPAHIIGFDIYMRMILNPGQGSEAMIQQLANHYVKHHGYPEHVGREIYAKAKEAYAEFTGATAKWCYNRRFFKSEQGRFGWGLGGVREGDMVAVFEGGQYPFVLREVEVGDGRYRIVGDCYLNGIMEGEGMEEGVGEVTEFVIV